MGSAKSRPRSSISFEEEVEGHSETTKTCCWTGIRKLFSKSKKSKSMAMHIMEDEMDSADDNDDVIIANDSIKPSAASIQSVTAVEPRDLHNSWSAPAVLGQDCHQAMMPAALSKVKDELPSTSYPKDVRVSSKHFLFYHRYINDEEKEEESVTSDIECRDEDGDDADVESNADDDTTPAPGLVYSEDEYEDDSSYLSSSLSGNDVTSDDEATLLDDGVCVDEITAMFLISLFWAFIRNPFYGIYQAGFQFVHNFVMGKEDEMDIDEERAVVVRGKTEDRTPKGHPERYPDFNIWSYIRNACDSVYQTGLQIIQDILIGEDEDEMDVEEERAGAVHGETEDRTPKGHPAKYPDSNIWDCIRKACDSVYKTGLQFIQDILIGEDEDEMDVEEERAGAIHGETEDRTPKGHPERYPDFNIWAYIRNACDSVYQTGLQIIQDIVIAEDEDEMDVD